MNRHCCACTSVNFRYALWPQTHSRQQSNDRSTTDGHRLLSIFVEPMGASCRTMKPPCSRKRARACMPVRCLSLRQKGRPTERSFFLGGRLVPTHVQAERRKTFHARQNDMKRSDETLTVRHVSNESLFLLRVFLAHLEAQLPARKEMTTCAGRRSECLLGTRPLEPCRPGGRLCVSCARRSARKGFCFAVDSFRGVTQSLKVSQSVSFRSDQKNNDD